MKTRESRLEGSDNQGQNSRRSFVKKVSIGGLGMGLLANSNEFGETAGGVNPAAKLQGKVTIKELRCAIIGNSPVVRIVTDAGISGYGQAEDRKSFLKPYVLFYKDYLVGMDPTDVERVMLKIRRLGGFKPWGAAVSAIEMALWDVAGKIAGVPVYKLLGGKIRDHVRAYGRPTFPKTEPISGEYAKLLKEGKEGFSIIKQGIGFHGAKVQPFFYGDDPSGSTQPASSAYGAGNQPAIQSKLNPPVSKPYYDRGVITEIGMKGMIKQVEQWKKGLGDEIGLALDCGPGFCVSDALRFAKAVEQFNLLWLEDLITGDYHPYVMADLYREVTQSTTTPIHTGEQIYLRQNFRELIEQKAVRVIGPDPADIGGIAEMKWVAEYADLHGIQIAPHGLFDGVFGLAAQVQVGSTMPENYIAFEYPAIRPQWWFEITDGLPDPLIKDGVIKVWDRPGLGVEFKVEAARKYLSEEDKNFFD
jgi:L-alanine-DL-glutamate epimerase-like enolase superfamily enzyme